MRKKKYYKDDLVRIYVRPETAYHLNKMVAQSKTLKYPGQAVDKIVRTMAIESSEIRKLQKDK